MYSRILSGGDVHTLMMAEGAIRRGHPVHFFAGHGLKLQLDERKLPVGLSLTDPGLLSVEQWDSLTALSVIVELDTPIVGLTFALPMIPEPAGASMVVVSRVISMV